MFFFEGTVRDNDIENFMKGAGLRNPSIKFVFKYIPPNHMANFKVVTRMSALLKRASNF